MKLELLPSKEIEGKEIIHKIEPVDINVLNKNPEELMKLEILMNEMIKFAIKKKGVGLSGIQVGVYKKIFVWQYQNKWEKVINPQVFIKGSNKPKVVVIESCLSYPRKKYEVKRHKRISVSYYTIIDHKLVRKVRELNGLYSVIFQHEYDHQLGQTIAIKGQLVKVKKSAKNNEKKGK